MIESINLTNFVSDKNLVQKNIKNKLQRKHKIRKNYEIKTLYFDKDENDITSKNEIWKNTSLSKNKTFFSWDNKTGIFMFEFLFNEKDFFDEIFVNINNGSISKFKPKLDFIDGFYSQKVYSTNLQINNIDKVKTIQISLNSKLGKKVINIVFDKYIEDKTDFFINQNETLVLEFQNKIIVNQENVEENFLPIKLSPHTIKQGFWNEKIFKIEKTNEDIFERNNIELISLDKIPTSSEKNSGFEARLLSEANFENVIINQNTYYDSSKKETIKGFGNNSNPGYIPPFEFFGKFFPLLSLKVNNISYKISWEQFFEKPFFKDNEGIYKINLETSHNNSNGSNWVEISEDLIEESKEYNFNFDDYVRWLVSEENDKKQQRE